MRNLVRKVWWAASALVLPVHSMRWLPVDQVGTGLEVISHLNINSNMNIIIHPLSSICMFLNSENLLFLVVLVEHCYSHVP